MHYIVMQFKCQFRLLFHIVSTFHFDGINFLALRFSFASTFIIKTNLGSILLVLFTTFLFSFLVWISLIFAKKPWTLLLNNLFQLFFHIPGTIVVMLEGFFFFFLLFELLQNCFMKMHTFITKISWSS